MKSYHSSTAARTFLQSRTSFHLNLAERKFDTDIHRLSDGAVHRSDRPEIESRILAFLNHSTGPDTAGLAEVMGIGSQAMAVHLRALQSAHRVWSQIVQGRIEWHISTDGRQFLDRCKWPT